MGMVYTSHDIGLANAARLTIEDENGPRNVKFQWPPYVSSDNRTGEWRKSNVPNNEPQANFIASSARAIALNWTYVVDGGLWNIKAVSEEVKFLRGYFARVKDGADKRFYTASVKLWRIGGVTPVTARLEDISIKHSQTLVTEGLTASSSASGPQQGFLNGATRFDNTYPLRTDITIALEIWTSDSLQLHIPHILQSTPEWY